jgi:hypothetical protein
VPLGVGLAVPDPRSRSTHEDKLPEVGKYNAGQKAVFWLMSILIIILICTGIVIWDGADCARRVRPEAIDRAEGKCRSPSSGKHPNIRTSHPLAGESLGEDL